MPRRTKSNSRSRSKSQSDVSLVNKIVQSQSLKWIPIPIVAVLFAIMAATLGYKYTQVFKFIQNWATSTSQKADALMLKTTTELLEAMPDKVTASSVQKGKSWMYRIVQVWIGSSAVALSGSAYVVMKVADGLHSTQGLWILGNALGQTYNTRAMARRGKAGYDRAYADINSARSAFYPKIVARL